MGAGCNGGIVQYPGLPCAACQSGDGDDDDPTPRHRADMLHEVFYMDGSVSAGFRLHPVPHIPSVRNGARALKEGLIRMVRYGDVLSDAPFVNTLRDINRWFCVGRGWLHVFVSGSGHVCILYNRYRHTFDRAIVDPGEPTDMTRIMPLAFHPDTVRMLLEITRSVCMLCSARPARILLPNCAHRVMCPECLTKRIMHTVASADDEWIVQCPACTEAYDVRLDKLLPVERLIDCCHESVRVRQPIQDWQFGDYEALRNTENENTPLFAYLEARGDTAEARRAAVQPHGRIERLAGMHPWLAAFEDLLIDTVFICALFVDGRLSANPRAMPGHGAVRNVAFTLLQDKRFATPLWQRTVDVRTLLSVVRDLVNSFVDQEDLRFRLQFMQAVPPWQRITRAQFEEEPAVGYHAPDNAQTHAPFDNVSDSYLDNDSNVSDSYMDNDNMSDGSASVVLSYHESSMPRDE